MNIALRVFWNNNPIPVAEKIKQAEMVINVPFGVLITHPAAGGGIEKINKKSGTEINLNTDDIEEGENKYFKEKRVLETVLGSFEKKDAVPITAEDSVIDALIKLQAQLTSKPTDGVKWVSIEEIGTFNKAYYDYFSIGTYKSKIEFARINGLLWIRGAFRTINNSAPHIMSITDNNYKCIALAIGEFNRFNVYRGGSQILLTHSTTAIAYDALTANYATQTISGMTSAATGLPVYITPMPVGELIIK